MNIQKENIKKEFWDWAKTENPRLVENAELGDVYAIQNLDHMFMGFAAAKARAIPDGFVVVPKEPTQKMLNAGHVVMKPIKGSLVQAGTTQKRRDCYKAMIEAAQEQSHEL